VVVPFPKRFRGGCGLYRWLQKNKS
jgi:hypothetical protein